MHDIHSLQTVYPLDLSWEIPEHFTGVTTVDSWQIHLAGWLTVHRVTGENVTASAAAMDRPPLEAAYFELLERTAVAVYRPAGDVVFVDRDGVPVQMSTAQERRSPDPGAWRFARANGIAGHTDARMARRMAALELVERDRVLRSWYGEIRPECRPFAVQGPLRSYYRFRAFSFAAGEQLDVAGVFGFPLDDKAPFICGFAAGDDWQEAVKAAEAECLQRLGFLWGAELPRAEIPFSPTPLYHQEAFLSENGWRRVERWLEGAHLNYAKPRLPWFDIVNTQFYELTPEHLKGRLTIVGAVCEQAFPLFFGRCMDFIPDSMPPELWVHPVA